MTSRRRLPGAIVAAADKSMIAGVRAGDGPHRIIGIWAVVVGGRLFARSWGGSPEGWYETFLKEKRGVLEIGGRRVAVRAVRTRGERLNDKIDRAYAAKYNTRASLKWVSGLRRPSRRARTVEFVPL